VDTRALKKNACARKKNTGGYSTAHSQQNASTAHDILRFPEYKKSGTCCLVPDSILIGG